MVLNKIIEGAADGPIKTLNATWDLIFGGYHNWIAKIQYKRELDLEAFKVTTAEKVNKIPLENLKEPDFSIIGPALESSKFYINEKEIRELFANLVSSSMDDRKTEHLHHSFVELIKQMSPNDAIIFKFLNNKNFPLPSVRYKAVFNFSGSNIKISDAIVLNSPLDIKETEISLINLERIGLIKIDVGNSTLTKKELYNDFYLPEYMNIFIDRFEQQNYDIYHVNFDNINNFEKEILEKMYKRSMEEIFSLVPQASIDIEKGYIELTSFGKAFIECCF